MQLISERLHLTSSSPLSVPSSIVCLLANGFYFFLTQLPCLFVCFLWLSSPSDLYASSIVQSCRCPICHTSCLHSDATSLPPVRATLPSPPPWEFCRRSCGVTTFPMPLRASQSPRDPGGRRGKLGLGTGARPDYQDQ